MDSDRAKYIVFSSGVRIYYFQFRNLRIIFALSFYQSQIYNDEVFYESIPMLCLHYNYFYTHNLPEVINNGRKSFNHTRDFEQEKYTFVFDASPWFPVSTLIWIVSRSITTRLVSLAPTAIEKFNRLPFTRITARGGALDFSFREPCGRSPVFFQASITFFIIDVAVR